MIFKTNKVGGFIPFDFKITKLKYQGTIVMAENRQINGTEMTMQKYINYITN